MKKTHLTVATVIAFLRLNLACTNHAARKEVAL